VFIAPTESSATKYVWSYEARRQKVEPQGGEDVKAAEKTVVQNVREEVYIS